MPRPHRSQVRNCRPRRFLRPGVVLLLILAQGMTALGFPVVRVRGASAGCGGGACGCDATAGACGIREGCCCDRGAVAALLPPAPAVPRDGCGQCGRPAGSCCCSEEEPGSCLECRTKSAEPAPADHMDDAPTEIRWVVGLKARQCCGEGPLGLAAELPAVPPVISPAPLLAPGLVGHLPLLDESHSCLSGDLLDPPPRCC